MSEAVKPNEIMKPIDVGEKGLSLRNLDDMFRFARYALASKLAPTTFTTPESILVAIQYGLEVGLTPMKALQSIAVVNGRPTIWGDASLGLVKASGLCEYVKETFDGVGDKMAAVCESKRKGEPNIITTRFSVDDAKTANLWGKAGPWKQYPARMLKYRARSFNLRDNFPDILGGMHTTEEMDDEPLVKTVEATVETAGTEGLKKRIAKSKKAETPAEALDSARNAMDEAAARVEQEAQFEPEIEPEPSPDATESELLPAEDVQQTQESKDEESVLAVLHDMAKENHLILKNKGVAYLSKQPPEKCQKYKDSEYGVPVQYSRSNLPSDSQTALHDVQEFWKQLHPVVKK